MTAPTPELDEDRASLARGEIPAHIAMPSDVIPTPLTDELLAAARTKKLLSSDPRLPWYRLAVKLERDLAAAQEALSEERNVSAWLSSDVTRLSQQLQEAQEARQRAEELAQRSTSRLVEMTEPGFIGAFAARDHWKERAERAEALAESYRKDVDRLDWIERNHRAVSINWFVIGSQAPAQPISFRAAIDAAIAREPK